MTLAPDLPDLAALGASGIADFLAEGAGLVTAARCKRLQAERGRTLLQKAFFTQSTLEPKAMRTHNFQSGRTNNLKDTII